MRPILQLAPPDAGELLTLQRAAFVTEARKHDDLDLPPLTETFEQVIEALSGTEVTVLGVRDGHRLVAAMRLRLVILGHPAAQALDADPAAAALHVARIAVAPDRQGQGLGSALLAEFHHRARAATVAWTTLFTGEFSVENLRLYERSGYRRTHREPTPSGYHRIALARPVSSARTAP